MLKFDSIKIHESAYQRLIRLLTQETKLNFDYYRRNFIERRIKARMIRVNCSTLDTYYKYLATNRDEFNIFLSNFNINYTYFFRNYELFKDFNNLILDGLNHRSSSIRSDFTLKLPLRRAKEERKKRKKNKTKDSTTLSNISRTTSQKGEYITQLNNSRTISQNINRTAG